MSSVVFSVPADDVQWGPVQPVGSLSCMQTAKVLQGGVTVCHITVQWPANAATVPVMAGFEGANRGTND
jgi:hypothetical protein